MFQSDRCIDWREIAKGRRTIRRYRPDPVPRDVLDRVFEIAIRAPSAHNRQPWRFVILSQLQDRQKLAMAMSDRLRLDRLRDGDSPDVVLADCDRSVNRISNAPLAILVCSTLNDMDHYPDDRRAAAEHHMAVQSTAMAMQNLLLGAHAEGLGASILCAPIFCPEVVRSSLHLGGEWEPQALITLGFPAGEPKPFSRRPVEDVVHSLASAISASGGSNTSELRQD